MPFSFLWGLWAAALPAEKGKKILSSEFGFEQDGDTAGSIKVSTTCRFSPVALCQKADLVLFKDGSGAGFKVGKVKLHFEVHGLAFPITSVLAINKHEPLSGYSIWTFSNADFLVQRGPD